jgi:sugar lactone lactonase YvrE
MLRSVQRLNTAQRRLVFFLFFFGGLLAIVALTVVLAVLSLNSGRPQARAAATGVAVYQFAALPDSDAYPSSVAANLDNKVYTGSYATGAVWSIDMQGASTELPDTRDAIGAVSGMALAPDGTLYVVDQGDNDFRTAGGDVKRITPDGTIMTFAAIGDERGFITPDDVALDSEGRVYVSDRGRNEVWRFDADGTNGVNWWTPPEDPDPRHTSAVTGLAYDAAHDAIIVTDPEQDTIYRVTIADAAGTVIYQAPPTNSLRPGFNGVTVTPDGQIYVAALGQNAVVRLDEGETPQLVYIAGNFRGASDVAYVESGLIYVTNWDQSALGLPLVRPRLPFAIDVIDLAASADAPPQ